MIRVVKWSVAIRWVWALASSVGTPCRDPEFALLGRFIRRGSYCVDVGANVGLYAFRMATLSGPTGHVVAIDPYSPNLTFIHKGARLLRLHNLETQEYVLSEVEGTVGLVVPLTRLGRVADDPLVHIATRDEPSKLRVRSTTLDLLVDRLLLPSVDFVKIDVEGAELMVLRGGLKTINRFHPVIFCEVEAQWYRRYGFEFEDVLHLLEGVGYRCFVFENGKLIDVRSGATRHANCLFIPKRFLGEAR